MPLIPATWEAEADRSLESRSSRPARPKWLNYVIAHQPGQQKQTSISKKKKKKKRKNNINIRKIRHRKRNIIIDKNYNYININEKII